MSMKRRRSLSQSHTLTLSSTSSSPSRACTPLCSWPDGLPRWERAGNWLMWGGILCGSASSLGGLRLVFTSGLSSPLSCSQTGNSKPNQSSLLLYCSESVNKRSFWFVCVLRLCVNSRLRLHLSGRASPFPVICKKRWLMCSSRMKHYLCMASSEYEVITD